MEIRSFAIVLAFATLGTSTLAQAQNTNPIVATNNEIGIAATGTLMNYQEHISPAPTYGSDIESGWMPGFAIHLSGMNNKLTPNLYFAINYNYASGSIAYHGSTSVEHLNTSDNATTNRVLARLGKGFVLSSNNMLTPYVAGGYQNWDRRLQGPGGYNEYYHAGLVGAGVLFQHAFSPRLVVGVDGQFLAVVGAGINVPGTVQVSGPFTVADTGFNGGFGTSGQERIKISADYAMSSQWHIFGGLNFTHFTYTGTKEYPFTETISYNGTPIIQSPGTVKEPPSSTNLFGMELGLAYSF
ncbi:hypothetical protein [Acidithiobacillus sp.]|uniref:hypothetical protein n=1 Tax=Acidithiobacillus sp. TaxID=1872118 RepID=UPI0025B9747D|nr:hypothetical protein [Acidithiobacillus sp.]